MHLLRDFDRRAAAQTGIDTRILEIQYGGSSRLIVPRHSVLRRDIRRTAVVFVATLVDQRGVEARATISRA